MKRFACTAAQSREHGDERQVRANGRVDSCAEENARRQVACTAALNGEHVDDAMRLFTVGVSGQAGLDVNLTGHATVEHRVEAHGGVLLAVKTWCCAQEASSLTDAL